jgi:YARHG domain
MTDQPRFCEGCGQPLSPDMRFCEGCGRPVAAEPPASPPPAPPEPPVAALPQAPVSPPPAPPTPGKTPWLIVGGAILIGLIGLGLGLYFYQAKDRPPSPPAVSLPPAAPPTAPPVAPPTSPPTTYVPPATPPVAPPVAPPTAPPNTGALGSPGWRWTSTRLVTDQDLRFLSLVDLTLMRNEIYARHGWVFNRDDLRRYFEAQPWYRPKGTLANLEEANRFVSAELSPLEKKNIQTILQYENALKYGR